MLRPHYRAEIPFRPANTPDVALEKIESRVPAPDERTPRNGLESRWGRLAATERFYDANGLK